MEYLKTTEDLEKYLESDEFKAMTKEVIATVRKSMLNQLKYDGSTIFSYKDNVVGCIISKDFVEKITDEIIDNSFCSDIFNDKTDVEIIKLDTVLDIIKRNLGGK